MRQVKRHFGLCVLALIVVLGFLGRAAAETVKFQNGITLKYRHVGQGPTPVIFLHGDSFSADI